MDASKPISRRSLLAGAAAAGAAVATHSLEPAPARAGRASADVVTLNVWESWPPEDMANYQSLITGFEKAHPTIKINFSNRPSANFETVTIPAAATSGTLPDVFHRNTYLTADWANRGWTLPLNKYVQQDKFDLSDFWPSEMAQMTWKGELHALPYDWSDFAIGYNKTLFQKKGIKFPPADGNWTWDDLFNIAAEFVEKQNGRQVQWGMDVGPMTWGWPTPGFVQAWGGRWLSPDYHTFLINNSGAQQLFQTMQDAVFKRNIIPQAGAVPAGIDPFASGQQAMTMEGSWAVVASRLSIGSKFDWDVAPLPKGPTGHIPLSPAGGAWSASATTKHPYEAWQYLKWLSSTQSLDILDANNTRTMPGRQTSGKRRVQVARTTKQPAHVSDFLSSLSQAYPIGSYPFYSEFATLNGTYVGNMLTLNHPVKDTLAAWQAAGQAAIKKYTF